MTATPPTLFREYEPHELGADGYPEIWHRGLMLFGQAGDPAEPSREGFGWTRHTTPGPQISERGWFAMGGVKDLVRYGADHRCLRCGHKFVVGRSGAWENPEPKLPVHVFTDRALFEGLPEFAAQAARGRGVLWSPCDERCTHRGPYRMRYGDGEWSMVEGGDCAEAGFALTSDPALDVSVEAAWRILTVHHLNGRKHDLRWWNLAALCQKCHLTIQRKVQMERVYPFEHSDWFKPFAAGWYAYAYEGRSLTREEAEADLDRLLALERVA